MGSSVSSQDAKELLVSQISAQAIREGNPLDPVERQMLYFSNTHWMPDETGAENDVFTAKYDQDEYEARVAKLIRNLKRADPQARSQWGRAIRTLRNEDHYILVMDSLSRKWNVTDRLLNARLALFLIVFALAVVLAVALIVTR